MAQAQESPDQYAARLRREASERAQREGMVDALLRERQGYVTRGLDDRVAQVDEQLRHYGAEDRIPGADAKGGRKATPPAS